MRVREVLWHWAFDSYIHLIMGTVSSIEDSTGQTNSQPWQNAAQVGISLIPSLQACLESNSSLIRPEVLLISEVQEAAAQGVVFLVAQCHVAHVCHSYPSTVLCGQRSQGRL